MTFSTLFGIRLNILKKEGHSVVSRFEDNLGDNDTNGGSKYAQVWSYKAFRKTGKGCLDGLDLTGAYELATNSCCITTTVWRWMMVFSRDCSRIFYSRVVQIFLRQMGLQNSRVSPTATILGTSFGWPSQACAHSPNYLVSTRVVHPGPLIFCYRSAVWSSSVAYVKHPIILQMVLYQSWFLRSTKIARL